MTIPREMAGNMGQDHEADLLDISRVRKISNGDLGFEAMLLDLFITESQRDLAAIRDAMLAGDRAGLRAAAHSLKGAAASIGARRLQEECQAMETIDPNLPLTIDLLAPLEQCLKQTNAHIRSHLAQV